MGTDGVQLALTQIYKMTAEVLRHFTFEMAHDRPWKTHNASFNVQTDVICRLERRKQAVVDAGWTVLERSYNQHAVQTC